MSRLFPLTLLVALFVSVKFGGTQRSSWRSNEPSNWRQFSNSLSYRHDFDDSISRRDFWPEHRYRRPKPLNPTPPHRNEFRNRIPPGPMGRNHPPAPMGRNHPPAPMGRNHPPPFWSPLPPNRPPMAPPTRHRTNNKLMPGYWDPVAVNRIPGTREVVRVPGGSPRKPLKLDDNIDIHINILDQVTPNPPTVKPKPPPAVAAAATTEKVIPSGAEDKSVVVYVEDGPPQASADNALISPIRKSDYHVATPHYPASVDFSSLFVALIPIALFLGATSALALATVTKPNQAVATAQQQQQQEEQNNNNDNNSNNNLMSTLLASLFASSTYNNNNYNNNYPYIIVINNTAFTIGRSSDQWQINLRNPFRLFDKLED